MALKWGPPKIVEERFYSQDMTDFFTDALHVVLMLAKILLHQWSLFFSKKYVTLLFHSHINLSKLYDGEGNQVGTKKQRLVLNFAMTPVQCIVGM